LFRAAYRSKDEVASDLASARFLQVIAWQWRVEDPTVRMYAGDSRTFLNL
jgi:hypothetical protein